MTQLPLIITSLSDANVAMVRLSKILLAEEQPHGLTIEKNAAYAIDAAGDFCYETAIPSDQLARSSAPSGTGASRMKQSYVEKDSQSLNQAPGSVLGTGEPEPFALKDINLQIPRGSLACIFGSIGSGKTALLEGLLGEMRQTRGHVVFGGNIGLVTQTPWIQSTTLRDNIVFGEEDDSMKLQEVVRACALESDLRELPDGIHTEIGGKYNLFFQSRPILSLVSG